MNRYWDSLRPFEKRLLVGVGSVLFLALNWWFVVPHFSDWERVKERMSKAQRNLDAFQKVIAMVPTWERLEKSLRGEGLVVSLEDQAYHFDSKVTEQQLQSGVDINSKNKTQMRTNQFFVEQSQIIGVQSTETNLVNFLYNLGASSNSLIRVRDLTLRPDQPHQKLTANIKLVASYQKNPPKVVAKTAVPAPVKTVTPPPKPVVTPPVPAAAKPAGKADTTPPASKSIVPANKQSPSPTKPTNP